MLGICIPIYRRPDQLRRCILSILRSIAEAKLPEVPILVSDDSCDDTNLEVLSALRRQAPTLVHHRNEENLGIDRNILRAVDRCQAQYAWIIGEDDRMTPEGIRTVADALRREPPFVYVNYASIDADVSLVLAERSLPLDRDMEMDAGAFLSASAWSMAFIGACVVRKDLWSATRSERYVGTYFAHAGRILEYLRGNRAYLVARSLVLNRCGAPSAFSWAGSSFEVLDGWGRMVDLLRDIYPAEVCDRAAASFRRAHGLGSLRSLSYLRADGVLNPTTYEKHVRNGPYPALSRGLSWWIARTPTVFFRAARGVLMAVRRRTRRRLIGY